ncbi:MAG: hypothetical protein RTU92_01970 [Candidatus Thorarchaeota archaeon]
MSDLSDITKSVLDEEERKRLIKEIAHLKDVLDSFKYGLNFEEFADAIFKTIDRQTISIKSLDEKMAGIIERMDRLETRLEEGIVVRVSSITGDSAEALEGGSEVVIEKPPEPEESVSEDEAAAEANRESLEKEAAELEAKIARLFEKENELLEMVHNDPAGAEEYDDKARVAREMRTELEGRLEEIKTRLK